MKFLNVCAVALGCALTLGAGELVKIAPGKGGALHTAGNYLYAVLDNRLCTYDITSPLSPRIVSRIAVSGNRQMVASDKYLYLSCRSRGVEIFSLENPAHPRKVSHFYPSELATGLSLSGNILAVTLRIYGVEFFDVSNPRKVRSLGLLRTAEAQSGAFFGDGKIAIGDWGACRVLIGDVKNPTAPMVLSTPPLDGYGDGVVIKDNILYIATGMHVRKKGKMQMGKGNGLEIFDVSDPKRPRHLGLVKFAVNPSSFPDWWSVRVSGNYAFVANAANGVYVVDVTDKKHPKTVTNVKLPGDSASQIAIAKGAVYISGLKTGLFLTSFPKAGSAEHDLCKLNLPKHIAPPPAVKNLRNLPLPGFVWSLAKHHDTFYAACAQEGVKEFKAAPDGTLTPARTFPGIAMDCAVSEKLLFIAADTSLKILERSTGKILSTVSAPNGKPFLQVRLFGNRLCTASRTSQLRLWDISDPAAPKLLKDFSGGGILYGDMLPERSVKGLFPVNWHSRFVRWINGNAGNECASIPELHRKSHQQNGITEINGKFLFIGSKTAYLLSPEAPEKYLPVPMRPLRSGIPTSDGGLVAVSHRRDGIVSFYRYDGKELKEIPERQIRLPFTLTGRAVFYKGKAYIPAGLCGIYYE